MQYHYHVRNMLQAEDMEGVEEVPSETRAAVLPPRQHQVKSSTGPSQVLDSLAGNLKPSLVTPLPPKRATQGPLQSTIYTREHQPPVCTEVSDSVTIVTDSESDDLESWSALMTRVDSWQDIDLISLDSSLADEDEMPLLIEYPQLDFSRSLSWEQKHWLE